MRIHTYCNQVKREWNSVSETMINSKRISDPNGTISPKDRERWRYRGDKIDAYTQKHVDLINAIVKDTELNEAKQVTDSTLTAIIGREAAYSGAAVDWDTILNSKFAYGPDQLYKDSSAMHWRAFRTLN